MDPSEGPVNSTPRREDSRGRMSSGPSPRLRQAVPLGAAALTALDPDADPDGRTLEAALTLGVTIVTAAQRPS